MVTLNNASDYQANWLSAITLLSNGL